SSSAESFAREYEKYTGDPNGRSIYAWAKGEIAEANYSKVETTSSKTEATIFAPERKGAFARQLEEILGWDGRTPEEFKQWLTEHWENLKDFPAFAPLKQGQAWAR